MRPSPLKGRPAKHTELKGVGPAAYRRQRRRALEAHALRQEGLKLREVGERLGVTAERARSLIAKGQRILDRDYRHVGEACERLIAAAKSQHWPQYREDHQGMVELVALEAQGRLRALLREGWVPLDADTFVKTKS